MKKAIFTNSKDSSNLPVYVDGDKRLKYTVSRQYDKNGNMTDEVLVEAEDSVMTDLKAKEAWVKDIVDNLI